MKRPTIFVTGATGKTGSAVVSELRANGYPVRALVHRKDERSERLLRQGAEVVTADLFDSEQLANAMRGSSRAYFCPPWHPHMLQSAVAFAVAAKQEKLEFVVSLSQWLSSPAHPSLATRQNWLVDRLFSMIPGVAHTVVNPGFFADNYLRLIGMAAQLGIFPMPIGESKNAPPSNEDIARVIVGALINPDRHAGKMYRPTGPELLSGRDMAAILSQVLKRKVWHIDIPMFMFKKAMRALGISAFEQSGIRWYIEDHKLGAFEVGAPNNHVELVTGREPEKFEMIAKRYAQLPEAQRSISKFAGTVWDFIRIGFTPAYNLNQFEQVQQHPLPSKAVLANESNLWRQGLVHGAVLEENIVR